MKKLVFSAVFFLSTMFSSASFAGCSDWGPVNYMYSSASGVLAIVNGTACWVTGNNLTAVAAVLATARANGLDASVSANGDVAIEYL